MPAADQELAGALAALRGQGGRGNADPAVRQILAWLGRVVGRRASAASRRAPA
jgi:hypothetical protein